jgi:hypothetical protein
MDVLHLDETKLFHAVFVPLVFSYRNFCLSISLSYSRRCKIFFLAIVRSAYFVNIGVLLIINAAIAFAGGVTLGKFRIDLQAFLDL